MKLSEFDYYLPKNLIAQELIKPRDRSRLLILDRKNGVIEHRYFFNIIDYLKPNDILVLNNSCVFPARLIGHKIPYGGKIEIFLHKKIGIQKWECLIGGRGREGIEIIFDHNLKAKILQNNNDGTWLVKFNKKGKELFDIIDKIGYTPLPPYIKRKNKNNKDKYSYQTIYANPNKKGSVAAPTAGLHFTKRLLKKIASQGIHIEYITLHVGLGTFAPVKTEDITKHKLHAEFIEVNKQTIEKIQKAKKNKQRIIAVGTTTVRTLEAIFNKNLSIKKSFQQKDKIQGWVDIFIYPGYKFKIVDAIITNFHLPKSTLLMLVSAFAGQKQIKNAYKEAVKRQYRFYSYGDAMLIK